MLAKYASSYFWACLNTPTHAALSTAASCPLTLSCRSAALTAGSWAIAFLIRAHISSIGWSSGW
ncbi:hypothetical protein PF005_g10712 [Phytophthora fragariae]|uniref:Uncharacterized protein n=1 Tax=Phytophthora fragariae TaxID=53985 RepID=A0A6A3KW24_9STRA|nr:hypothetical protein PF009_g11977 [Phytophthora fragariae]KAE9011120.1 hypothetical protein PF011_g9516 [Phytophthora fragariae]KAE9113749.1 hypothetical protein PF007_g10634 [Phytophthora fragariae]KAE9115070.1 hypothetical protein PF010_g9491 [Phytophthora fragariae]KAE9212177.1 hypothetical protein PF005_g10712 [Phytophthora fragariae]